MNNEANFEKWCDQWAEAQKKGIFKEEKPFIPTPNYAEEDFFGNYKPSKDSQIKDPDAEYWRQVYDLSRHAGDAPDVAKEENDDEGDDKVLQEDTLDPYADDVDKTTTITPEPPKRSRKTLADTEEAIARAANPIYHYSKGKDQLPHVTANWTDGKELIELHKIKINLEKLESKMNAADYFGQEAQAKKIQSEIKGVWEHIDKLSNVLTPDFTRDYLS